MTESSKEPSLGVRLQGEGAGVSVFSAHAEEICFCPFDGDRELDRIPLLRGGDGIHSLFIAGLSAGQAYGLRAKGTYAPDQGHLFDESKLLIDPYARSIDRHADWNPAFATFGNDTGKLAPKSVITETLPSRNRSTPRQPKFIYEIPVRAFTRRHTGIAPELRGTMAALATEPVLDHLKQLGCDTIELMPLAAWTDERHLAAHGLRNAWGYNPVSFFAAEPLLVPGGEIEVRSTLQKLHDEGIQVVLDVVLNHTGESDYGGGTYSLRGLDNASYYRMSGSQLVNDTGTGNTMMLDRPPGHDLALAALHHWAAMGFDGFRYDLAPVLGRTAEGFSVNAPLLRSIQADPLLRDLIHIAEPWDVGPGGYQLGNFPPTWHEWNDHYRDDVRRYWRGDGSKGALATRLAGSSDIFRKPGRQPSASINFVAAHDGFTLRDTVKFKHKNNHANGEHNRDGNDGEVSWQSLSPELLARCLLATLFLSRGTPMLTAGDEFGRTQRGNNNGYAQDNEVTWLDWDNIDRNLLSFVRRLTALRRDLQEFFDDEFLTSETGQWFGRDGKVVRWDDGHDVCLVIGERMRLALLFSRDGQVSNFELPPNLPHSKWQSVLGSEACGQCIAVYQEIPLPQSQSVA